MFAGRFIEAKLIRLMSAAAYLDRLNPDQRRAVEHGVGGGNAAGAAPGHRRGGVGQDQHARPSRRPPHRQRRRSAPHPAHDLLAPRRGRDGRGGSSGSSAMPSAGKARTRRRRPQLVGHVPRHRRPAPARVRRRRSASTRPSPSTTARTSADLMNLVRHELGLSRTEKRFPTKGTCLAIYSRAVNEESELDQVLLRGLSLVRRLGRRAEGALRPLCRGEAEAERPRLRRPPPLLGGHAGGCRCSPPSIGGRFDHVLVDEYQDTNRLQARDPPRPEAGRARG